MAKSVQLLSPTALASKPDGLHHDGAGLYLQVKNGGRSWVFRYMRDAKAHHMGLGPIAGVSLAKARRKATEYRSLLHDGVDPIEVRKASKEAARVSAAKNVTFKQCAERYVEAHKSGWRNAKHSKQWLRTLETYAFPLLGGLPVHAIDTGLVMKVLQPIWAEKTETATRVRQRIEAVLNWATTRGFRRGDNPASWRGHLDSLSRKRARFTRLRILKRCHTMTCPRSSPLFQSAKRSRPRPSYSRS